MTSPLSSPDRGLEVFFDKKRSGSTPWQQSGDRDRLPGLSLYRGLVTQSSGSYSGLMADLITDIMGQVERLPLKPSPENALLPLFEAVSNALHAIQDRFGNREMAGKGRIDIRVLRNDSYNKDRSITGFRVTDNGTGFDDDNYKSFRTPFSRKKIGRGGKGIGRLGWLKVFEDITVHSCFKTAENHEKRAFRFLLRNNDQLEDLDTGQCPDTPGSIVELSRFKGAFASSCPAKPETIAQRLIAHFLPIFAADSSPQIRLVDDDTIILSAMFEKARVDQTEVMTDVEFGGETVPIIIKHMRCNKCIRPRKQKNHWLIFSANDRGVREYAIDEQLGLQLLDEDQIYIGAVTGDFLDANVNPQRTDFTISDDESKKIRRAVASSVREYLSEFIDGVNTLKKQKVQSLIRTHPQFLFILKDIDSFVESLKPGSTSEEEIYSEMSRGQFRRQRTISNMKRDISKKLSHSDFVEEKMEEYQECIFDDQRGALANYVVKRKAILDLLETLKGRDADKDDRHYLEDAVHKLVCPMRVDSHQLEIEDHNLWILDDRLAFFNFFASDKPVKTYTDMASGVRPDLAFFYDSCMAWNEKNKNADSVVLVEFKRPGRDDYSPGESPLRQCIDYIDLFRSNKTIRDAGGGVIAPISDRTVFHCYIIADITQTLTKELAGFHLSRTPDGIGMFGYINNPKAFVEIVPYQKLLNDARQRNAILFSKLGLNQ